MAHVSVGPDGLTFHDGADALDSLDVLLDGARVCSVSPRRSADAARGTGQPPAAPWPTGLQRYLVGSARVELREHVSGRVVLDEEVAFTGDPGRVRVVDADGHPLAFDKWGQPGRAFEAAGQDEARALALLVRELLDDLAEVHDRPSFVAYGTLLGAVREGGLIGHDFDADVAYLSDHWHPADVARESFRIQRALAARGWVTDRPCDSMYQVRATRPGGETAYLDIFPSYFRDGTFEVPPLAQGPLRPDQVSPTGTVDLVGVPVRVPADPDAVLALTYGEHWRTPDPAFHFEMPASYRRRMRGWMGHHLGRPGRWRRWHRERAAEGLAAPDDRPSDFAAEVASELAPGTSVLDLGCGTGADTVALAAGGSAVGLDYAAEALEVARERGRRSGRDVDFRHATLYDLRATLGHALDVATRPGPKAVYARLALDALGPSGRTTLLLACRTVLLGGGGRAYLETRVHRGNPFPSGPRAPWAGPPAHDDLLAEIARHGGTVVSDRVVRGPRPSTGMRTGLRRLVVQW